MCSHQGIDMPNLEIRRSRYWSAVVASVALLEVAAPPLTALNIYMYNYISVCIRYRKVCFSNSILRSWHGSASKSPRTRRRTAYL